MTKSIDSNWHKRAIAVTGIFGSGKSSVSEYFAELGCLHIDADELAHEQLEPEAPSAKRLIEHYGLSIRAADGGVSRSALRKLIFSNDEASSKQGEAEKAQVEAIMHPEIGKAAALAASIAEPDQLIVYDCPLLFETGLNRKGFFAIVLVSATREQCISRGASRLGISEEQATRVYDSQMPLDEKAPMADYILENKSSKSELEREIEKIYTDLKASL